MALLFISSLVLVGAIYKDTSKQQTKNEKTKPYTNSQMETKNI